MEEQEEAQDSEMATEAAQELEQDAKMDSRPKLPAGKAAFHTEDTTINTMLTVDGKMLMSLTEGGFQYLLAGARCSVGLKAGRYMFEVQIAEVKNPSEPQGRNSPGPRPRQVVRIGLATAEASLLLVDAATDSFFFENYGAFVHAKKRQSVSKKFGQGQVAALLVNLVPGSPNASTVSLFIDGVRASPPQPIPEALRGKPLFPAVTFRNVTLQAHFGPLPMHPLPFKCDTVQGCALQDCEVKAALVPKNGKHEVVIPVGLPDEGTFDWLDQFLASHPGYVEISERAILDWASLSGVQRTGGYVQRSSNDKPEPNFGLQLMDDWSVLKVIRSLAPLLPRNYVIMEVRGNLLEPERKAILDNFPSQQFNRVVHVAVGEPPASFQAYVHGMILKDKQAKAEEQARQRKQEQARRKAELEKRKQMEEERQKRLEAAKKAKEARESKQQQEGEEAVEKQEGNETEEKEEKPDEKAQEKEEKTEDGAEHVEVPVEETEDVTVELTEEEKKLRFRKKPSPDLSQRALSQSYSLFSLPSKAEGFEAVNFVWHAEAKAQEYLKEWVLNHKLTSRVEELKPSEWFSNKLTEFSKVLTAWRRKQQEFKDPNRARQLAARKAELAKKQQQKQEKEKPKVDEGETQDQEMQSAAFEEPEGDVAKEEDTKDEPMQVTINADDVDPFGVENILDIGSGEPLHANFEPEDWALLSLRFELHLLVHAFRHDLQDPERTCFPEHHMSYYYQKYYGKPLVARNFSVTTNQALLELIKDTIELLPKGLTLDAQLSDDTPLDNFVRLTEDARRDRQLRIEAGDEAAALRFPVTRRQHDSAVTQRSPGYGRPPAPAPRPAPATSRPPPPSSARPYTPPAAYAQKRPNPAPGPAYGGPSKAPRTAYGQTPGYGRLAQPYSRR